jgi:alkanesulfonate monooxygenase SsuD/methylene tetrahydromethanopterin reductase-like flavin-dependent oxidoreductase (luciferase family)
MLIDLLFDPFGGSWSDLHDATREAEQAGFDGAWLYDHLAGSVHGESSVLECWTTLTALAVAVPRLALGPMVLNVANRDPGLMAVMAATLQQVSEGRLLLGLGAGGGPETPYAAEQEALGRPVPGGRARRAKVEAAVARLREVWSGATGGAAGFLRPDPVPPVIIGGFGPKMAELAGRVGDGMNAPAGPRLGELVGIARQAHAAAGHDPDRFVVTASGRPSPAEIERLAGIGVGRLVVYVGRPYLQSVRSLRARP